MANYFLKVDKDLFKLGLNPTEILILAQVMEFNTNTGDCFISDKVLAENFGVSDKTISRTIKSLEEKGFIVRDTKNVKGGKERHIRVNLKALTTDKMTVDGGIQPTNCPLATDKLSIDNRQNDLIKDNIKDKEKDNNGEIEVALRSAPSNSISLVDSQKEEEIEVNGERAQVMTGMDALNKYGLSACANRTPTSFSNCFWISGDLVKLI